MQIMLTQIAQNCQAKIIYPKDCNNYKDLWIDGAVSDNRQVNGSELFVCIAGNRVDGHDFAMDAIQKGAKAILAERNPLGENPPVPVLLVENSVKALGMIANARRKEFSKQGKVIAITGSAGKTSLKELLAHILSLDADSLSPKKGFVGKNLYNYNTQLGVALAILNLSGKEKYWVLELGISKPHDMEELGNIVQPDYAIILNVANAHSEGLGELGVAYHKAYLLNSLQANGMAFVNFDYKDLVKESEKYQKHIIYFSADHLENEDNRVSYKIQQLALTEQNLAQYEIKGKNFTLEVQSPLIGNAGAENSLAATSLALSLGYSPEVIAYGIKTHIQPNMRFNQIKKGNWLIFDDCYNANPLSNLRMLEAGAELAKGKEFYAVLGEMKELGKFDVEEHYQLGLTLGKLNPKAIFWVGKQGENVQKGLNSQNFMGKFISLLDLNDFEKHFSTFGEKQTGAKLILFKGSRTNKLEDYLNKFLGWCDAL